MWREEKLANKRVDICRRVPDPWFQVVLPRWTHQRGCGVLLTNWPADMKASRQEEAMTSYVKLLGLTPNALPKILRISLGTLFVQYAVMDALL